MTAVIPSSARALASGPASRARPVTIPAATPSASSFASASSPQTSASPSARPPASVATASECSPAATGPRSTSCVRSAIERRSSVGRTPDFEKRSSLATLSTGVSPIAPASACAVGSAAAAEERADCDARNAPRRERLAQRPHGQDRRERHVRVARRQQQQLRLLERLEDARRRRRRLPALEADVVDLVAVPAGYEPLLER